MDDGENWEQSTLVNAGIVTRQQRLWFGLGKGTRVQHPELPGNVFQGQMNDANQRAFYRRWEQLLSAASWLDAKGDPGADAR